MFSEMMKKVTGLVLLSVLMVVVVLSLVEIQIRVQGIETKEKPSPIMHLLNEQEDEEDTKNDEIELVEELEATSSDTEVVEEPKEIISEEIIIDYSVFDDAIFVGNSRTQGLFWYTDLSATEYTYQGLTVDTIHTEKVINQNGRKVTIADAIKGNHEFKTAYIMMGTNELGWKVRRIFIERYEKIIDMVLEANPECTIYVQSILPVCERISINDKVFNMTTINEFNELIKEMCERKGVTYIDIAGELMNEAGYLPDEASNDGIHINKIYCRKWLKYLSEHYI